jgi:hypothetical protein
MVFSTDTHTERWNAEKQQVLTISFSYIDGPDFESNIPTGPFTKVVITVSDIPRHILPTDMINDDTIVDWWADYPAYVIVFLFRYAGTDRYVHYDNLTMSLDNYPITTKILLFADHEKGTEEFKKYGKDLFTRRTIPPNPVPDGFESKKMTLVEEKAKGVVTIPSKG